MSDSRALVKAGGVELPAAPIATIAEAGAVFDRIAASANLITPITRPDHIPPMHAITLRVARLDPTPERGDVYVDRQFCKEGERALTKVALLKLWNLAGGTLVTAECGRTDDRLRPHYCSWRFVGDLRQMDGTRVRYVGEKEIDLADGTPAAAKALGKNNNPDNLANARLHLASNCETKALLRMVRAALALRSKYTAEELAKPWVVPALVAQPDMSDPEVRRMVAAQSLGLEAALYGPAPGAPSVAALPAPAPPTPVVTVVSNVRDDDEPVRADVGDDGPDPWDATDRPIAARPVPGQAPARAALPVDASGFDAQRRRWVERLNKYAAAILTARGPEDGARRINDAVGAAELSVASFDELVVIGSALRAEAEACGGAR